MSNVEPGTLLGRKLSRRSALAAGAAAGAVIAAPYVRRAHAAGGNLRMLIWQDYNIAETVQEFEAKFGATVSPAFFDGNSEAFNKMKAGGTGDFDLVMADGFWPRLYLRDGLIQPLDEAKLPNLANLFADFKPGAYDLLLDKPGGQLIGAHNCWGSYGITMNTAHIPEEERDSLQVMFDEKYAGHLATGARFEENIAMAGIMACTQMGTKDKPRPDGQPFNPYKLTDEELEAAKQLLIKQKALLVTRYQDYDSLQKLMRPGLVWASPEFSEIYRRLTRARRAGEIDFDVVHTLQPKEGGLGWIDSWQISSGVTDPAHVDLCHAWINHYISKESMFRVGSKGVAPCYDVRDMMPPEEVALLMLDRTVELRGLHMFDQPSSPEKWERVWSEVEAA
ncbi:MAG TPA: extracellular solute-binding protein [Geminicoccus sp.]|jgi:spermidine/putrescine-binding protein|uniref:ABC transporter substrate-binding protein n=1 Tax=Geminicoccus sp. TaxID=2024832 RepID=UPI002E338A3A|nr:extracellular solute-binding protein [Geminicoccus sp.]HEX2529554.1 extracellular solute-binding protein [Geminicoccus sp.]